ncbi:MAG: hypothetical protein ABIO70_25850 [Pseudomonadota bacterium]
MSLTFKKPQPLSLKNHSDFNEAWLQDRLADDPSLLGLGDLFLLERERVQERAGRLDLLLSDPEQSRRFEVEIMLGPTDESHIIRCIEYWDIERRRYPAYDHVAVLVAEDITGRFLNVLSLFAGSVPLVCIQLNALQVDDFIILDFVKVLDQRLLRRDDEAEAKSAPADRKYWENRASAKVVKLIDDLFSLLNEGQERAFSPNYNRYYIGVMDGHKGSTFVFLRPRKQFVHMRVQFPDVESWLERIEEAGLDGTLQDGRLQVTLKPGDEKKHRDLLVNMLREARKEYVG